MAAHDEPSGSNRDANTNTSNVRIMNGEAQAGPSRRRSPEASAHGQAGSGTDGEQTASNTPRRAVEPDHALSRPASPSCDSAGLLDLATFSTPTLLRMLASLLQQIASANDQLRPEHDEDHSNAGGDGASEHLADEGSATGSTSTQSRSSLPHPSPTTALFQDDPPHFPDLAAGDRLFTAAKVSLSHPSSILSFHARHVPSISIEAYLLRILKYCPTTNEVFLGLLVYFDRMSKLGTPAGVGGTSAAVGPRGFAIDSYNVHRLVIAGVTVASKFFSDVFYTNSRYAKVGGLPPHELNQLELQFLLLNNFTLMIPPEEMQKYGDRLLAYWQGREQESGVEVGSPIGDKPAPESTSRGRATSNAQQPVQAPARTEQEGRHTPMEVDEPRQQEDMAAPTASATAPTTPARGPQTGGQNKSLHLTRSVSMPRRPPSTEPSPVAPATRSRERDRPTVAFGGTTSAAPSIAHGFGGWQRSEDGAVGVGP